MIHLLYNYYNFIFMHRLEYVKMGVYNVQMDNDIIIYTAIIHLEKLTCITSVEAYTPSVSVWIKVIKLIVVHAVEYNRVAIQFRYKSIAVHFAYTVMQNLSGNNQ